MLSSKPKTEYSSKSEQSVASGGVTGSTKDEILNNGSDEITWQYKGNEWVPTKVDMYILSENKFTSSFSFDVMAYNKAGKKIIEIPFIYPCVWLSDNQNQIQYNNVDKYQPIFYWTPDKGKKYGFGESVVHVQLKDLIPNEEVNVNISFTITSEAKCPYNDAGTGAQFHLLLNTQDIYVHNPFTDMATIKISYKLKTDEQGQLVINLTGWLNWCVAHGTPWIISDNSDLKIEYKNK